MKTKTTARRRVNSDTLIRHTAVPAVSGYVYQIQLACLRLFDLQEGEQLGIEVLDDIHVERDGTPFEFDQVKYDRRRGNLTSRSREFWKTLGIWARAIDDGSLDISTTRHLILMTTAGVAGGSIPAMIATHEKSDTVIKNLKAQSGFRGKGLQTDFDAVMALPSAKLQMLVEHLEVHANLPGLVEVTEGLKRHLRHHGFHERTVDDAAQRLQGWLWDAVVAGLDRVDGNPYVLITEAQFHAAQCRVRDELTAESLPVRFMDAELSDLDLAGQKDRRYMRQLELIGVDNAVKSRSVSAFFRASSERAEWTERSEVLPDELGRYDHELTDRWAVEFGDLCAELQHTKDEAEHRRCCQRHFHTIERLDVPIRQGWLHRYLTTGSYHILADRLAVGWHPRYSELLGQEASGEHIKEHR